MKAATVALVDAELARQQELKRRGKFTRTCDEMSDSDNLAIVIEELSEVAEEIGGPYPEHRDEEIIQVIACLVGWLERPKREFASQLQSFGSAALRAKLIMLGRMARDLQENPGEVVVSLTQRRGAAK